MTEVQNTLSDKEQIFAESYLTCWNKSEAARVAGYGSPGQAGYELLKKPEIRSYVDARLKAYRLAADEVLARLSFYAQGSTADFLDEDGYIDLAKAKEAGQLGLLKKVKVTSKHVGRGKDPKNVKLVKTEIELHDPVNALVWIGKHHALFTERVENKVSFNTPILFSYVEPRSAGESGENGESGEQQEITEGEVVE